MQTPTIAPPPPPAGSSGFPHDHDVVPELSCDLPARLAPEF